MNIAKENRIKRNVCLHDHSGRNHAAWEETLEACYNPKTGKYQGLIHIVADPAFLKLQYEAKGRGQGYMTEAVDPERVDGINNS